MLNSFASVALTPWNAASVARENGNVLVYTAYLVICVLFAALVQTEIRSLVAQDSTDWRTVLIPVSIDMIGKVVIVVLPIALLSGFEVGKKGGIAQALATGIYIFASYLLINNAVALLIISTANVTDAYLYLRVASVMIGLYFMAGFTGAMHMIVGETSMFFSIKFFVLLLILSIAFLAFAKAVQTRINGTHNAYVTDAMMPSHASLAVVA